MADETIEETTVEEKTVERKIKVCDRCTASSEFLDCPISAFNQVYVNPSAVARGGTRPESAKPGEVMKVFPAQAMSPIRVEVTAPKGLDLCPDCYRGIFGDEALEELEELLG